MARACDLAWAAFDAYREASLEERARTVGQLRLFAQTVREGAGNPLALRRRPDGTLGRR